MNSSRHVRAILLLSLISIAHFSASSQKTFQKPGERIRGKSIFISREGADFTYFSEEDKEDNAEDISGIKTFSLSHNYCNVYIKWENPLRFKLSWSDSLSIDPSYENAQILLGYLKFLQPASEGASKDLLKKPNALVDAAHEVDLVIPTELNSSQLIALYIFIRDHAAMFSDGERTLINNMTVKLKKLDNLNAIDFEKGVYDVFKDLYIKTLPSEAIDRVEKVKTIEMSEWKGNFNEINNTKKEVSDLLASLVISDQLNKATIKIYILDFLNSVTKNLKDNSLVVSKLDPIIADFEKSLKNRSRQFPDYFKVRNIRFEDGKVLNTTLTVAENELDETSKEVKKKKDIGEVKFVFKRYDFVSISISTGIFYGSTELQTFGISPSGNEFVVTQETIDKSSAVTAVFGNINFNINSQYFAPLIQLGVDPTKKNPFFLLGGGFSVPAARFALSAGGIWTWNQSLNKLSVGDKIPASTDLEKDMKSNFDVKPRGWYIGIQYNF